VLNRFDVDTQVGDYFGVNRRQRLRRATIRGIAATMASVLLASCAGGGANTALPVSLTAASRVPGSPLKQAGSPATVNLRTASSFAILAGSTVTNTGPSVVDGDIGISPGTALTGFPPGIIHGTFHSADAVARQAKVDLTTAYNDAMGRTGGAAVSGNIGGQTLLPGVYKAASSLAVSSGDLTLDGGGNTNAVFIFQITSTFVMTSGRRILLTNGASAANVFFAVGSSATLGTTTVFNGNLLVLQSITVDTGATIHCRALTQVAAVTLQDNTIGVCPATSPSPSPSPTAKPTATPTAKPTATPTAKPTAIPTATPTAKPTSKPTAKPTATPTAKPTAKPTATPSPGSGKIYVSNWYGNNVTTYSISGIETTPTLTGLDQPGGVALDAAGKIFVTSADSNAVNTYIASGARTTPTLGLDLNTPVGVTVDAAGKIYVTNSGNNTLTTYTAAGVRTTPTITEGLNRPTGVAVDSLGTIYVANYGNNTVTTYDANGTRKSLTITEGLDFSSSVAVDKSGKVYVTNAGNDTVTTYTHTGTRTSLTISKNGLMEPMGITIDANGKIYVANEGCNTVTTYWPSGSRTSLTIRLGLNAPTGVAVRL